MKSFYTKKGDLGQTHINHLVLWKDNPVFYLLGSLDEFNSFLGLVRNFIRSTKVKKIIFQVQQEIFILQAKIYFNLILKKKDNLPSLKEALLNWEEIIDKISVKLHNPKAFIVPGINQDSAWLHLARAKIRLIEQLLVKFYKKRPQAYEILSYVNRLSSLFYVLALWLGKQKDKKVNYQIRRIKI